MRRTKWKPRKIIKASSPYDTGARRMITNAVLQRCIGAEFSAADIAKQFGMYNSRAMYHLRQIAARKYGPLEVFSPRRRVVMFRRVSILDPRWDSTS